MLVESAASNPTALPDLRRRNAAADSGGFDAALHGATAASGMAAVATGTYLMAAATAAQVIASTQQAGTTAATDTTASPPDSASASDSTSTGASSNMPIGIQHYMHDIANDPDFAAQQANLCANSQAFVCFSMKDLPKNGDPASVWVAFGQKVGAEMQVANDVQQQVKSLYQRETAQGIPPAQVYADMLKLKSSQPQSYLATQSMPGEADEGSLLQTQASYLERCIAASGSGGSTTATS